MWRIAIEFTVLIRRTTMTETNQQQKVTDAVREAVKSGTDVHQQVKEIVLQALTKGRLDMENIRSVTEAVSKGIDEGIAGQDQHALDAFVNAANALDDALAIATEASTLAIQEAAYKASSQHDFNQAIKDIQNMEGLFIDSLEKLAKGSTQAVADIVDNFIDHAGKSGTAVGKQSLKALDALADLPKVSANLIISSAAATASALAEIGSGILAGLAESLQPGRSKK
jgi:hypothetical protein